MQKTLKTIAVVSLLSAFNGKSTKNWDGDKWKLGVWLIRFVKGLYQIQLRSDYIQAGFSSYLNSSIMWHDQKSHLREASEQSGIGDFFFVSRQLERSSISLIKIDNEFFFQSLDVAHRSIVNGVTFADRYELLCIIIEHEQVYHLNFRRKK